MLKTSIKRHALVQDISEPWLRQRTEVAVRNAKVALLSSGCRREGIVFVPIEVNSTTIDGLVR